MKITYDTATGLLLIDVFDDCYSGANISACLERHGRTVSLVGVSFGVAVDADGAQVLSESWPAPGIRYIQTDQDVLTTVRASWQPGQQIVVRAWCVTSQGGRVEAEHTFTAPISPVVEAEDPFVPEPA